MLNILNELSWLGETKCRNWHVYSFFFIGEYKPAHRLYMDQLPKFVNYIFSKNPVVSIRNEFIYYKFIFQPIYIETLFWFVYFKGCYNQPGKYPMSLTKVSVSDPKLPI